MKDNLIVFRCDLRLIHEIDNNTCLKSGFVYFLRGFVWLLRVATTCGYYVWLLRVATTCGYYVWQLAK
jgi:hypothetical protein